MPVPAMSEAEFVATWHRYGNVTRMAEATGINTRAIQTRRQRLSRKGHDLPTRPEPGYESRTPIGNRAGWTFPRQEELTIPDGVVVVFSDCHYWPGEPTIAHKALLNVIKAVKPRAVIANGDIFDGGSIGRHDSHGWADKPSVKQELEACQERMGEIELAIPKGCETVWNVGNHDVRFERNLCSKVPEYANLMGMRLEDHFDRWHLRWSTLINEAAPIPTMVKHRFASSGIHAGYNSTLRAGYHTVSGHTHQLEVKPWGDYRGRRYGVQTGSLADLHGPAFEYHENSPSAACSGFAVLTFRDGNLLPPELCEVIDGVAHFRGEVVA